MIEIEFKGVWLEVYYNITPKSEGDNSTPSYPGSYDLTGVKIKGVDVMPLVDNYLEEIEIKLNQTL